MHLCTPPPPKSTLFPYTTLFRSISNPTQPRARNPVDIPFNCITTLRCCVTVLKRSGITVELTRRRESKHPLPHQASYERRSRRSRPTICYVSPTTKAFVWQGARCELNEAC